MPAVVVAEVKCKCGRALDVYEENVAGRMLAYVGRLGWRWDHAGRVWCCPDHAPGTAPEAA